MRLLAVHRPCRLEVKVGGDWRRAHHGRPGRRDLLLGRERGRRRAAAPRGLARQLRARRGHDHVRGGLEVKYYNQFDDPEVILNNR